ncbi:MAG TPA: CBS domain-containing protein, partial [Opitutales bacterium]|nr:CBS domain-containing protein [Opitutales bacterium]
SPPKEDARNLPVSTIMSYDVVTLRADALPPAAVELVANQMHGAYPVLDAQNKLQGMLAHDKLESVAKEFPEEPLSHSLDDLDALTVVYPDMSIREVANVLVQEDLLQAPVVSRKYPQHLIGIVTLHDVARQQSPST